MRLFQKRTDAGGAELRLRPVQMWGQGWPNADIVGESNYGREIHGLLPRRLSASGTEVTVDVVLVREPTNRHDRNAVAVRASTGIVGYLPREEAARYAAALDLLAGRGMCAQARARVWGCIREEGEPSRMTFVGSVRVALPEPHMMFPVNGAPATPHALLPAGSAIQVGGEEHHRDDIAPWLNERGEAWVHATLHPLVEATARSSKTVLEVRIDERPVGRLTPRMSQDLLPAVEYLDSHGLQTCVRAIVKGNALKADVVLYTARAGELSAAWLTEAVRAADGASGAAELAKATLTGGPESIDSPPPAASLPRPSADWYPDPRGQKRLRYWNGSEWTEHVAD